MKFALVANKRVEATSGAKGYCPCCGSELIGRDGPKRINHWAHKYLSDCDKWWENETDWHRLWKNHYSSDWQEIILHDEQTEEKHIADIRTSHNLVIEFQHSYIKPQERISREKFYKNMIWIVDGTRRKNDYIRFIKGLSNLNKTNKGLYIVKFPEKCFPSDWLESSVPVIFDFQGEESIDDVNDLRNGLYCLYPGNYSGDRFLDHFSREPFINATINGDIFKEQQKPIVKKGGFNIKRRESPYYYDPNKRRIVRKRRL